MKLTQPQPGPCKDCAPTPSLIARYTAGFTYHCTTKENDVKFMHQSLCYPLSSPSMCAIKWDFFKGAPHLTVKTIRKYLMPSPATSKGHMKRPRKGLQSTTVNAKPTVYLSTLPSASLPIGHLPMPGLIFDKDDWIDSQYLLLWGVCRQTHKRHLQWLHGRIPVNVPWWQCLFFVMYHYKTNAIFATPIPGLDSKGKSYMSPFWIYILANLGLFSLIRFVTSFFSFITV